MLTENRNIQIASTKNTKPTALSRNKVLFNTSTEKSLPKKQLKQKPQKAWKGDQLLLDDLDKIYKKMSNLDRLEL